jgi:superfamily II DNA or RNA helicase
VNEFLDYLKEEVLPGVWSKGVALSRNMKSVEKISPSSELKELKFKIQTTERILAYQVTLWPLDQDAYCNCGSKVEPCHHIVAVALAVQAGHVTDVVQKDAETGTRLAYTWVVEKVPGGGSTREKISLKRELIVNGVPSKLEGSLVALIGGVQSGRLKVSLPSTTPEDIKLDELFIHANPSWSQVLRVISDFPALPVIGILGVSHLTANAKTIRDTVLVEAGDGGGLRLTKVQGPEPDQRFSNGIVRFGDQLATLEMAAPFKNQTVSPAQYAGFLTEVLPRLRDGYDLDIRAELPEFAESEPELSFKTEVMGENLYVTPEIVYPKTRETDVILKDPEKERELMKSLRANFGLAPKIPTALGPKEALRFRENLAMHDRPFGSVDAFLGGFLAEANVSLEDALAQKDLLMKLLVLREKKPQVKARFQDFLSTLRVTKSDSISNGTMNSGASINSTGAMNDFQNGVPSGYVHPPLLKILREYQKQGVQFLNEKRATFGGAILADDMGLGKTLQTLALIEKAGAKNAHTEVSNAPATHGEVAAEHALPSLVIAPSSLLSNWLNEAKRFRPDLKTSIYHGSARVFDVTADLVVTSYSLLRMDAQKFLDQKWAMVILDEAHIIRNPDTQAAVASFQLDADFRIALTGTPIQNRKRDLLSLFQFVTPGIFEFEDELEDRIVKALILRRTKAEVLPELPPKTYLEHAVELTIAERSFYHAIFAAAKQSVVERLGAGEKISPLTIFEILLRSRQALDHPALIDPTRAIEISTKLARILEVIDELIESGQSILVYSQWTSFLDLIERAIENRFRYLRLDGSTENRGEVVDQFQNDERPTVFLLSLHAGGVGLNLTRATHVMFCEPWWNPYVELQAEDRAYRLGQEKPVTIHRFTTVDSIEEKLQALKAEKIKLQDAVFEKTDLLGLLE